MSENLPKGGHGERVAEKASPRAAMLSWTVANTLLAGLLILLSSDAWVALAAGGAMVVLSAASGAIVARQRMAAMGTATLFDLLMAWLPGFVALVLSVTGLAIVLKSPNDELMRLGGIALFLFQILFIAILGATPSTQPATAASSMRQRAT